MSGIWGLRQIQVPVRVHKGFLEAWTAHNYSNIVLTRVDALISELGVDPSSLRLLITGHSLGGALATLAAHALRLTYPTSNITVYTYGQPRVGNDAFAYEYNQLIPNHWAVIKGQDAIAAIPKGLYKRVGHRVLLNDAGEIIVRPTYLEIHLITKLGTYIVVEEVIVSIYMLLLLLLWRWKCAVSIIK